MAPCLTMKLSYYFRCYFIYTELSEDQSRIIAAYLMHLLFLTFLWLK